MLFSRKFVEIFKIITHICVVIKISRHFYFLLSAKVLLCRSDRAFLLITRHPLGPQLENWDIFYILIAFWLTPLSSGVIIWGLDIFDFLTFVSHIWPSWDTNMTPTRGSSCQLAWAVFVKCLYIRYWGFSCEVFINKSPIWSVNRAWKRVFRVISGSLCKNTPSF